MKSYPFFVLFVVKQIFFLWLQLIHATILVFFALKSRQHGMEAMHILI
jgi:hypothetical protein